jgi:hypothetical protein
VRPPPCQRSLHAGLLGGSQLGFKSGRIARAQAALGDACQFRSGIGIALRRLAGLSSA